MPLFIPALTLVGLYMLYRHKYPGATKLNLPAFVMFMNPGCGHCVAAKPEFVKLAQATNVNTQVVDLSIEANQPLGRQYNVGGIPHFVYISADGSQQLYSGERTVAGFVGFLAALK